MLKETLTTVSSIARTNLPATSDPPRRKIRRPCLEFMTSEN